MKGETESNADEVIFVVTRLVRPGCEQKFEDWLGRISEAESKVSGCLSREDIPPLADGQETWTHVVRFASSADQAAWFETASYKALIEEVHPLCSSVHRLSNIHGFGGGSSRQTLSDEPSGGQSNSRFGGIGIN